MSSNSILIVDDEPTNLAILKKVLEADYTLTFARNGVDGLAAARKHLPSLVLLDVQMPGMDGYDVCRTLKADPVTCHIPVIFVSAMNEVGDEVAGFACGCVDYIIKPVSPTLVRARVRNHLSLVHATMLESYVRQLEAEKAKTARLSRILEVLSSTNSAIARISEPTALFKEACRIAVDQGRFGVAWVGLNRDSAALELAACEGVEPGGMFLSTSSSGDGKDDFVEQTLASGKVRVCNDVRTWPTTCHVSRDALSRGYQSVIGLPLSALDQVIGIMVLYAREAGFFDEEELKLLSELAGDISFALQAIAHEKRASFLTCYDALTGMPNTTLFLDRLDQLIQAAHHQGSAVSVVVLNLDRFKQLNDAFGRHAGDQVLRSVAKRLNDGLPHPCSVARLGADNFAVLTEQASSEGIKSVCDQILGLLEQPVKIEGKSLFVSARLGVAVYPTDADDAESLFRNAEAALKQNKAIKARYLFYSPAMNSRLAEKLELESQLKTALRDNQFVLHFQPKVDLNSGAIVGAEALIRWRHPERGLIPPVKFIPLAEETGLIVPIGDWVINAVCEQQALWRQSMKRMVPIAVNLSTLQFREGNVLQVVRSALSRHTLESKWLDLELTESLVMQNPEEAERIMCTFRELGVSLSLDDFGTGYSSLAYLKRFPFTTVKIDRSFVIDVDHNPDDAAIATAIIAMAHALRMTVIAEGVETPAQLDFLRARLCDQIQGYYFSRPVEMADFEIMLQTGKRLELAPLAEEHGPRTGWEAWMRPH